MANYIEVYEKLSGERLSMNEVDERMCKHFAIPVDPKQYGGGLFKYDWFNNIAYYLADWKVQGELTPEICGKLMAVFFEVYDGKTPGDTRTITDYATLVATFRIYFTVKTWRK